MIYDPTTRTYLINGKLVAEADFKAGGPPPSDYESQTLTTLKSVVQRYRKLKGVTEQFNALAGATSDSPLLLAAWEVFDAYVDQVSEKIGDKADWLTWFIWENECGARGFEVGMTGSHRKINSVEDFAALMEELNNGR